MKKINILAIIALLPISLIKAVKVEVGGFAQLQNYGDSRLVEGAYDDLSLIAPKRKRIDAQGKDINQHGQFTMTALSSQLHCRVTGPEIKGFETSAYVEFDFVGTTTGNLDVGSANLRHAYGTLKSENHSFLFGQFWHPIRPLECTPETVAYNNGAPISIYALDPQFRYYYRKNSFEFMVAAIEQTHLYESEGPLGETSLYMRRAIVPNLHAQLNYVTPDFMFGTSVDYKRLVPRIVNTYGDKTNEQVNSVSVTAHAMKKFSSCTLRTQAIYGQNISDLFSLCGYAITDRNPVNDHQTYAPVQAFHWWFDLEANNPNFKPGIFAGFVKGLGTTSQIHVFDENGQPTVYGYLPDADYIVRVSPRLVWNLKNFQVGLEEEITGAAYGPLNNYANVCHSDFVINFRTLVVLTYFF